MTNKERYATIGTWERVFHEEGMRIGHQAIKRRLKLAGIAGRTARDKMGRLLRDAFFAESTVRSCCKDLLSLHMHQESDGFIEIGGDLYATINQISKTIGVSNQALTKRIRQGSLKAISGKSKMGHIFEYYCLSEAQMLCADLLDPAPCVDDRGITRISGSRYGTLEGLAGYLGISSNAIKFRLQSSCIESILGENKRGQSCRLYPLSEIEKLCQELTEDIPQADARGLIRLDGEIYGMVNSLAKMLGLNSRTLWFRIRKTPVKKIKGKKKGGQIHFFYSLSGVRKFCKDLLDDLPEADKNGFVERGGEVYGTIPGLSKLLKVTATTVAKRIKKQHIEAFRGRANGGLVCDLYSVTDVRGCCHDLLQVQSYADADGFMEVDGRRYGMKRAMARYFGIAQSSLRRRLRGKSLHTIKAKDGKGIVRDFYPCDEVRELCANLIAKKSKKKR